MVKTHLIRGLVAASLAYASAIEVGDTIPSSELHYDFPPTKVDIASRLANKKAIIVGLPGAFTPTWSNLQVPGYLDSEDLLKNDLDIDEVIIYCVNDAAVMKAWAIDQGVAGVDKDDFSSDASIITLMGDPYGDLTAALEMEMTHPGPASVGIHGRCKRFALYVENGVVEIVRIAEAEDDPAGDDKPDVTLADAMIRDIRALKKKKNAEL